MQSNVYRFPAKHGESVRWFLCSDLHLGHVNCDVARIKRELQAAVDVGASILINGDVFDAVTCGDKRYTPGQTVDRIAKAKDSYTATCELGAEVLGPFASHIKVIGVGNHETAWVKYRQSDPVSGTISLLNLKLAEAGDLHRIKHGGISGYVVSLLDVPSGKGKPLTLSHRLHYHHGVGGDAPVTGGLIAANRTMVGWLADTHTEGHRHNLLDREYSVGDCRPNGRIVFKQVVCLMTGSYLRNYRAGRPHKDPLQYTYAEESAHPPKPVGGKFLVLTPEKRSQKARQGWRIRQDYHSALTPIQVANLAT